MASAFRQRKWTAFGTAITAKKTPHRRAVIGTGLGLSIVKEILQLHNAAFGVDSELEKGSDFWFILPLDREETL